MGFTFWYLLVCGAIFVSVQLFVNHMARREQERNDIKAMIVEMRIAIENLNSDQYPHKGTSVKDLLAARKERHSHMGDDE